MQDTGKYRNTKDQYYTNPIVAKVCVDILKKYATEERTWIEPSAGAGVFLDLVPHAIGYDIDPKDERIFKQDFLETSVPENAVVFGNPPFGRQASIAKKFIKHSAEKASVIALILPKSFIKPSMQKAFPLSFHLIESVHLPEDAFIVNGAAYSVPCVFQVWMRKQTDRRPAEAEHPFGFSFVKESDRYDIAFRRVGFYAGKCSLPGSHSAQSHYFIKLEDVRNVSRILEESQKQWFVANTAGPNSISKGEACVFLNDIIGSCA